MRFVGLLLLLVLQVSFAAQQPPRVDPASPSTVKPVYREPAKGEAVIEGLLQRVECPYRRPVLFTLRVDKAVERFEAPRLDNVEYIAHTPDFKGPMTCGGRGKGDHVRLTWKKVANTRRGVAIEFLPER